MKKIAKIDVDGVVASVVSTLRQDFYLEVEKEDIPTLENRCHTIITGLTYDFAYGKDSLFSCFDTLTFQILEKETLRLMYEEIENLD